MNGTKYDFSGEKQGAPYKREDGVNVKGKNTPHPPVQKGRRLKQQEIPKLLWKQLALIHK